MIDRELIEASFEQAAESLGDITPLAYERFFVRYPQAEELFLCKGAQFKNDLQNQMVRDAIYVFLEYLDTPDEVDIVLKYTIPQHLELNISMAYFNGLLEAVAEVVCEAAPETDRVATEASWTALLKSIEDLVAQHTP